MTEYLVSWQIFVEARTPEEAARRALEAQRDAESAANCFDVSDETGRCTPVVCSGDVELSLPVEPQPIRHLRLVKTSRA